MLTRIQSPFWESEQGFGTLKRIGTFEQSRTHRPTVVVPIIDHAGRPLVVRHNTPEESWGLIQGRIELKDPHPLAAGRREAFEEGNVTDDKVLGVLEYLGEVGLDFVEQRMFATGYSQGGYYIFVGIMLRQGADVDIKPPPGQPQALLERYWCSSIDAAIAMLRDQPDAAKVSKSTKQKVERALIPALKSIYQPQPQHLEMLKILEPIT